MIKLGLLVLVALSAAADGQASRFVTLRIILTTELLFMVASISGCVRLLSRLRALSSCGFFTMKLTSLYFLALTIYTYIKLIRNLVKLNEWFGLLTKKVSQLLTRGLS